MATIFISHSKKDAALVGNIKDILKNIGHVPIIEEFIPEDAKKPFPWEEIQSNILISDVLFLFLTDNIVSSIYTQNWVLFEIGSAAAGKKPVYVFERQGIPVLYPIPYITDYMIFDEQSVADIIGIQKVAKNLTTQIPKGWIGAGAGALAGTVFGPIGTLVGAIAGGLIGHGADAQGEPNIQKITCPHDNCRAQFRYYSPNILKFRCPACRQPIQING